MHSYWSVEKPEWTYQSIKNLDLTGLYSLEVKGQRERERGRGGGERDAPN